MPFSQIARYPLLLTAFLPVVGCTNSVDDSTAKSKSPTDQKESARKANPKWAERLFDQAKYDDAITEASQVLLSDPKNSLALLTLGRCLSVKGDNHGAIHALQSIPENDILYGVRSRELMIDWAINSGPWDEAEKWTRDLLGSHPDYHKSRLKLAALMNVCGRRYEANRELETVLVNDKLDAGLLLLMLDPSEPIDTRKWADAILKQYPNDTLAKLALANYTFYNQEYDSAIQQYQSILASKSIPDAYAKLSLAYARTEKWNDLAAVVKKAPQEAATLPGIWIALGAMYESQQNYSEAAKAYLAALDTYDAEPEALRGLARSYTANNEAEAARDVANKLARSTSIGDRLKRLSREINDHEVIQKLADDLQFFGRDREALGWLIYSWGNGGNTPSVTKKIQELQSQLAAAPPHPTRFVMAKELWPKQIDAISKMSSLASNDTSEQIKQGGPYSIKFQDIASEVGLKFSYNMGPLKNNSINVYQTNGTGIGAIDYDLDGWIDLYLPQAGGVPLQPSPERVSHFYRNIGGKIAKDIYPQSGIAVDAWGQGVAVGDFDGDGMPDIFVACYGESSLWQNCGDGTFSKCNLNLTASDKESMSTSVAMADVNGDSLPDIIETNYSDLKSVMSKVCYEGDGVAKSCSPTEFASANDRIYLNKGDGTFESGNDKWTLQIEGGRGYGIVVGNFDRRAGNDVYIANDMNANHYLASRESSEGDSQKYRLYDESALSGTSVDSQGRSQGSMGIAVGDMNRDDLVDMFVTNFYDEFNVVYAGTRGGIFNDATTKFKMSYHNKKTLGFGTQAIDFDRDGYLDLAVLNGHVDDFSFQGLPYKMPAEIFAGSSRGFSPVPNDQLGPYFSKLTLGRALASIDWNRDLKVDLVAGYLDHPLSLLLNETTTTNHAIQFELVGTSSDRDATGAYVEVHAGNEHWTTSVVKGNGYFCSNEALLDVGIGQQTTIDRVVVTWPNQTTQEFANLKPDNRYLLIEGQSDAWPRETIVQ